MERPNQSLLPRVLRLVVVEDQLDTVHTTALLLREMGHVVDYAINGFTALDVVRRLRPDFVLVDIGLPGMDGFEVCKQVKADPELRGVQVLALTAYSDPDSRERARQVGFDGYYVKPIGLQTLSALFGEPLNNCAPTQLPHPP
jgi:CheY-like chemotaxis protein